MPTAVTTISPKPSLSLHPDSMNGCDPGVLGTDSDSPVIADSSTDTAWPERSSPSAGIWSPAATTAMSPTTRSKTETFWRRPPRSTLTLTSFFSCAGRCDQRAKQRARRAMRERTAFSARNASIWL